MRTTDPAAGSGRTALLLADACRAEELRGLVVAAGVPAAGVEVVDSLIDALAAIARAVPGVLVLELGLRPERGLELVDEVLAFAPGCAVVAVADAPVGAALAAEARRRGASTTLGWDEARRGGLVPAFEQVWSAEGRLHGVEALSSHMLAIWTAIDEAILVFSPTGRILDANESAQSILGYSRDELRFGDLFTSGFRWSDEDGNELGAYDVPAAIALRTGCPVPPTMQHIQRSDGTPRWIECAATPLVREGTHGLYGVVSSFRDVTEQRATHEALLAAEHRQHLLLEHAAEGHILLDAQGRVVEVSPSIDRFWPIDSLLGKDARELVHPDDRRAMRRLFVEVLTRHRSPVRAEVRVVDTSGERHWVDVTVTDRLSEPAIAGVVLNVRDITERKVVEESMARLSAIVESSSDSIVGVSLDGRITSWNPASEQLYGRRASEAVGSDVLGLVAEHHRELLMERVARVALGEHVYVPLVDAMRADGSSFELSLSISPVYDSSGELVGAASIGRDITERRQLEQARQLAEERFRLGFEKGAIGMLMFDPDGTITRVNAALCTLVGREERELLGRQAEEFIHPDDIVERRSLIGNLLAGGADSFRSERRLIRSDGATVWTLSDATVVRDEDGTPAYIFSQLQDITDRKRSERALEQQALHDSLTGLPNRLALEQRLERALTRARRSGSQVAVLFIDVDRFKLVNDGLGHAVGDKLLVELAGRIARCVRAGDVVARFGGDEFIIVREGVGGLEEAALLGERILAILDEPVSVSGKSLHLSVSCGIAVVGGASSVEEVLRDADVAMYRAKDKGRARVEIFDEALHRSARQRLDVEQALRTGLDRGELRVAYQPIVRICDGELVGLEALVRWQHPERGLLPPSEFIPAAEESGLIVPLGEHVLRAALAQIVQWRATLPGCDELWVSVNLSSRQLSLGNPVARCAQLLAETGAPPRALHVELTESTVMADVEASISRLEDLRALGVTVAIDDFGTGYSSLSYLSLLPVGLLKIDHSFVGELGRDGGSAEIVRAIVLLAQGLGVEVCAEGVEEPSQLAALAGFGCELGQGYLWARPLMPLALETWVRERHLTAPTVGARLPVRAHGA